MTKIRVLLSLVVACLVGTAFAQNEAMFRSDPRHSGVFQAAGAPDSPKLKWQFLTKAEVISSPAVVGDTLYVGSADHNMYAINAENGTLKWKFKTGGRVNSSPAVDGGVVFFESYDSIFYAVDAATGALKWKFATQGERRFAATHLHGAEPASETMPDPFDCFLSSPAVVAGVVYFGSGDTNVYALDEATGALKWKFKTGDVVHASPAVANGAVYVGSWDSYFYALDATTGKEKWRFKTGEDPKDHNQVGIQASAVVANGMVYFGCRDSNFYALDASTGEKKWVFNNKGSWVIGSAVVQNGRVYFATSDSGLFYALDAASGAPVFSLKTVWPAFSSPSIAGSTLYIGTHEGKLYAINLSSQQFAWMFQTDGWKKNGAAYTNSEGKPNYEAVFSDFFYNDMVQGVEKLKSVGAIFSSPAVQNNVVYFGSTDGNIYALMEGR